ncbi:hypothetical protein QJ48_24765 [Paenibacillus sp. A3]|uniref:hypothetical protein n=1 Tax=Paenibacillus sp. A3 TaxID=1337054 RepID=UPI0006D53469|nr:hypothetical protein [Paenibacillus sp. A3]KPV56955.1 hypothetical protein QJ48_24765 [Paenibacillus sp. A3]
MERPTKKKIYNNVVYNTEYKNGQYFESLFNLSIDSYKIDDLIVDEKKVNRLATDISAHFVTTFQTAYQKEVSEKQQQFSLDCARLIFSELKFPNKSVVIPAKAGFGKSTMIYSILETIIGKIDVFHENENELDLGMIIVSDRINDLKNTQKRIREKFGYYSKFNQADWIYVMEGWNKENCLNGVTEYYSGCCTPRNCSFYKDCWVFKQRFEQNNSPIVAMSNERFSYYRTEKIDQFRTYNSYQEPLSRKIILIDEKPVLEKHINVDETMLLELSKAVNEITILDPVEDSNNKMYLKDVLHEVNRRILDLQKQYKEYRSRIIFNDEDIFDERFLQLFSRYFKYQFSEELSAIRLLFKSGGLFCNTFNSIYFKSIFPKEKFHIESFRTYIFDATGEGDPSYTAEFVHFNIDDYKEYTNLTFHIINENMSRNAIEKSKSKLKVVADWINKTFKEPVYVVSYKVCGKMNVNQQLNKLLKNNKNVVFDKDKNGKSIIPYFGNTKGKNSFQHCRKMVQIGWNRLPSDETVAAFMYTFIKLDELRLLSEPDMKKVQGYIQFDWINSRFGHDNINIFEMRRLMGRFGTRGVSNES